MRTSRLIPAVFICLSLAAVGCEEGDWLGPFERGLRDAVNGWDMWATDAVRPYEEEMPPRVEGTVPVEDHFSFENGSSELRKLHGEKRKTRSKLTYRRYCHHCHGPNGDGRIIVGESLEIPPADLRLQKVQSQTDRQLFDHLESGGNLMLPFAATMSPLEMLLAIEHVRSLKNRPSTPYYSPKNPAPLK